MGTEREAKGPLVSRHKDINDGPIVMGRREATESNTLPGQMKTLPLSKTAQVAIAALGVCGYVGGWLILVLGGFHHAVARYTAQTTFVDGAPALALAALSFALAAIGASALLQPRTSAWRWHAVAWVAILAPPLGAVALA